MGVVTDRVVAPLDEAITATRVKDRRLPWVDVKGLGIDGLLMIYASSTDGS